jgi:hypothetical protein
MCRACSESGRADAVLLPGHRECAAAEDAPDAAAALPAPPLRVHSFVLAARSDYFRAALAFRSGASEAAAPASFALPELCAEGAAALREWLYTGSVRAWRRHRHRNSKSNAAAAAAGVAAAGAAVGVAARVAAAADARVLPPLACAARARAHALLRALDGAADAAHAAHAIAAAAAAAHAATQAASAGEWRVAEHAVRVAAGGFAALRDAGALDAMQPGLADAIRAAHVARSRRGGDEDAAAAAGW